MCVCVCVCLGVSLHTQINHEPSSSWSVNSTGGAARAAPRVFQGPPALPALAHSYLPLFLVGGPPACLSCAGTGSREEEKKGRKEEIQLQPATDAVPSLQSLIFLTLTLCTAYSSASLSFQAQLEKQSNNKKQKAVHAYSPAVVPFPWY